MTQGRLPLIADRYKGRTEEQKEVQANWDAWQRLREMSLEPSQYLLPDRRQLQVEAA